MNDDHEPNLRDKLNQETARIPWAELQRHFAHGDVLVVSPELDLIDVAVVIARDDAETIKPWMQANQLLRASDEQARHWLTSQSVLWAVVVKPWILVQDKD